MNIFFIYQTVPNKVGFKGHFTYSILSTLRRFADFRQDHVEARVAAFDGRFLLGDKKNSDKGDKDAHTHAAPVKGTHKNPHPKPGPTQAAGGNMALWLSVGVAVVLLIVALVIALLCCTGGSGGAPPGKPAGKSTKSKRSSGKKSSKKSTKSKGLKSKSNKSKK